MGTSNGSRIRWILAVLAGVGLLIGTTVVAQQQSTDYVIGSQDVLTVTVWDQPEVSGKYTVEADGTIAFPLIRRVKAGGLTLRQFETELNKQLREYFRNPQASVAIEQYRSQRIFIVGEVRSPGTYPLTGDMTLIEALARAGSTTASGNGEALVVRAPKPHNAPVVPADGILADVIHVDLKRLETGQMTQNLRLQDGDTIFLPRADTFYVFGHVKSPGSYAIQGSTTVLQALSLAGGITDRGAQGRIRVIRLVGGKEKQLSVKLSDLVQPGDTIIVPERYF